MSVTVPMREAENANGHLAARVFDGPDCPADPVALVRLRAGLAGTDLAAPPVVLPDFHHKGDKEMPSSIAVATRETIRPTPLNDPGFLARIEARARHFGSQIGVLYGEPFRATDPLGFRTLDALLRTARPEPGAFTG